MAPRPYDARCRSGLHRGCRALLFAAALARPAAATPRCGPGDVGNPIGGTPGLEVTLGSMGGATVHVHCGEDAAQAAGRLAVHRRHRLVDGEVVLKLAGQLEAYLAREAADYKPPDELHASDAAKKRPRLLQTGGAHSRRAMDSQNKEMFADAAADLLRGLLRPNIDPTARDKLLSILVAVLKKADKKRAKALEDGDLSELFFAFDMEDDGNAVEEVDASQLKKKYRQLSLVYHPDKNAEAAQHFQKVRDAYEILSDPIKTLLYDTGGLDLVKKYEQGSDSLERTENIEKKVEVDLKDVYVGQKRSVAINRRVVCRSCRLHPQLPRCKQCKACPGERRQEQHWLNEYQYTVREVEIPSEEKCTSQNKEVPVMVERGMMSGDRITHQGMASEKPKKISGDLLVTIAVRPHALFKRVGNDLAVTVRISLYEALLGFKRELVHLDGHIVRFSVPRGAVARPGSGLEIAGEGMPLREDPSSFGKLQVKFEIDFPEKIPEDAGDAVASALRRIGLGPGPLRVAPLPQRGRKAGHRDEL